MGNKGSKGENGTLTPQAIAQQQQQHQQEQQQQDVSHSVPSASVDTPAATSAPINAIGGATNTAIPQTDKQVEHGLEEFGNTDRMTADDAYNHWDKQSSAKNGAKNASGAAPVDDIGGTDKVRNKELEKTMRQTMRNTMCNGDLRQLVKLPPNADLNEWIALNTIHFYRTCVQIGRNYRDFCSPSTCPLMSAGNVEYLWRDDKQYLKPTRVPACRYVELALQEAYETIEDSHIFPSDETQPFPKVFLARVKEIFKRLFRQFAHLYYSHYDEVKQSGSSKHLNSTFKHFIYFVLEFGLIDSASLQPLQKFIDHIVQQNPTSAGGNGAAPSGNASA